MKKLCVFWLSIFLLCSMCGCHSSASSSPPIPVSEVMSRVLEKVDLENIDTTLSYNDQKYSDSFEELYTFSKKVITDGGISYASSGGYADEITIVYVGDRENLSDVKKGLVSRIDTRILSFTGYKPAEVEKLQQAEVFAEGQYVCLIICDNILTVKAAIQAAILNGEGE